MSRRDAFPIPDIHDALDHLRGSRCFATIDLLSCYPQFGMTDRAKERSAFCTRRGLFSVYPNAVRISRSSSFVL